MNDFLQSLRNGNNKRFDGTRKQYSNYSNRGNERNKGQHSLQRSFSKEYWPTLKQVLEDIAEYQKRMADADERRAHAEERKADALESIARHMAGQTDAQPHGKPQASTNVDSPTNGEDTPEAPLMVSPDNDSESEVLRIIREMRNDRLPETPSNA